ncbi:hypothetical protein BGZ58_003413 [Dissophora ornata]|nr:hypothetical protein BGZ58_003413 [Dissophora ornata]
MSEPGGRAELFESTQKYNCPLKTARHPGLISYIQQIVQSIRTELHRDSIHRICIVTLNPAGKAIDRFVFEMSMLRAFEERLFTGNGPQGDNATKGRVDKGKGRAIEDRQDIRNRGGGADGTDSYIDRQFEESEDIAEDEETLYRTSVVDRIHRQQQQQQQQNSETTRAGTGFEGIMQLTTDIEMMLRAMLLKISVCDSYLKPLVQGK